MPNSNEQLSFDVADKSRDELINAARQVSRINAFKESFAAMSKANQYFAFADQVEKEPPLYAKKKRKNPTTGELECYDPERLLELGVFYDEVAQLAMYKACFYCHKETKQKCFINTIEPKIRYERGFGVWFGHSEERKDFLKQLGKDLETVCLPIRQPE